jgi:hypothetical protein
LAANIRVPSAGNDIINDNGSTISSNADWRKVMQIILKFSIPPLKLLHIILIKFYRMAPPNSKL